MSLIKIFLLTFLLSFFTAGIYLHDAKIELVEYTNYDDDRVIKAYLITPINLPLLEQQAVVYSHGLGTWEEKKQEGVGLGIELAHKNYVTLYPDIRTGLQYNSSTGASDLHWGMRFLRQNPSFNIKKIGCMGSSYGNLATFDLVNAYPNDCQAYFDLYGVMKNNYDVNAMQAPTLIQVGDADTMVDPRTSYEFDARLDSERPDLPHSLQVFKGEQHGFFFNPDSESAPEAHRQMREFYDWTLRDGKKPEWFTPA